MSNHCATSRPSASRSGWTTSAGSSSTRGPCASLIEEDGISGVTSNPTIFEKAMGHSDRYDDAFREQLRETSDVEEIFNQLAYQDIRDAADLLRPTFDRTNGADGYVSFEVAASLAYDADGTIEAAKHHRAAIDRPNVLIKVPGTDAGVTRVRGADRDRPERQRHAAVRGVAIRGDRRGLPPRARAPCRERASRSNRPRRSRASSSPASTPRSTPRSRAPAARTCAARRRWPTRRSPTARSSGSSAGRAGRRWRPRARASQRPLWASTSTKNPDYSDTLYVDNLIGPDTVNTMPDQTIDGYARPRHGQAHGRRGRRQAIETMKRDRGGGRRRRGHRAAPARRRGRRVVREVLPGPAGRDREEVLRAGPRLIGIGPGAARWCRAGRLRQAAGRAERRLERAAHLLDGDHAAEHAVAVDRHQRPEPAQVLRGQDLGDRPVLVDAPASVLLGLEHRLDRQPVLAPILRRGQALLAGDPEKPVAARRSPGTTTTRSGGRTRRAPGRPPSVTGSRRAGGP